MRTSSIVTNRAISRPQTSSSNIAPRQQKRREKINEERRRKASQKRKRQPNTSTQRKKGKINYAKYRPKSSVLSSEDFKCIFCFQIPKSSDNDIVLCPKCKHPAHIHEFKDWSRNSPLCSRCDSPIPLNFRRNPEKITAKKYQEVMRYYLKKK